MNYSVKVELDQATLRKITRDLNGPVGKHIQRKARQVEAEAKRRCPVNTGRLRSSITAEFSIVEGAPTARVGSNVNYGSFIHHGTGIYGPKKRPITPKKGNFLVFTPKGGGAKVFAKQVRGIRPTPFLVDALKAVMRR